MNGYDDFFGEVGRRSRTNVDFGSNPDNNPDPGFFKKDSLFNLPLRFQ